MKNVKKIELLIQKNRPQKTKLDAASYVGGGQSQLTYLGHRTSQLRAIYEENFSFEELSFNEKLKLWNEVIHHSQIFEVMNFAFTWAGGLSKEELIKAWPVLKTWSSRIDNWAHSDSLCHLYAQILEEKPSLILPTLKKWNRSNEPWLIRISMVSLFYYSRMRKKHPEAKVAENFLSPHWDHEHYYVQKAIGWTLREYITAHPKTGLPFFTKNILRVSGVAFTAAAERLTLAQKNALKKKRRR